MERWLPVKGYEGIYEVSSSGEVKSLARSIPWVSINGVHGVKHVNERILKPKIDKDGYEEYCLSHQSTRCYKRCHRLVAETFIPTENCEVLVVDHIDAVKTNNHVDNLQWLTSEENTIKYYSEETSRNKSLSSLSKEDWLEIGEFYNEGLSYQEIFNRMDIDAINPQTLWEGLSGRRLSSVTGFKKGDFKKRPHPVQKLTDSQVMEILHSRLHLKKSLKSISDEFGITVSMVSRFCSGKRRPDVFNKYIKGKNDGI